MAGALPTFTSHRSAGSVSSFTRVASPAGTATRRLASLARSADGRARRPPPQVSLDVQADARPAQGHRTSAPSDSTDRHDPAGDDVARPDRCNGDEECSGDGECPGWLAERCHHRRLVIGLPGEDVELDRDGRSWPERDTDSGDDGPMRGQSDQPAHQGQHEQVAGRPGTIGVGLDRLGQGLAPATLILGSSAGGGCTGSLEAVLRFLPTDQTHEVLHCYAPHRPRQSGCMARCSSRRSRRGWRSGPSARAFQPLQGVVRAPMIRAQAHVTVCVPLRSVRVSQRPRTVRFRGGPRWATTGSARRSRRPPTT